MIKDKKNNSEKINLVLLKKIGKPIFNKQYSKKKLNLFLKKLYSEQSSLIMISRLDQDFNEIKNLLFKSAYAILP